MSQSIRFFCPHCSLIIKIGPQMFGKTVICPQCEKKVEVPFESDSKAEELYCFLKGKKREKRGKNRKSPSPPPAPIPESLAPIPRNVSELDEDLDRPVKALTDGTFEHVKPSDIERWIAEFWAGVPEQERRDYQQVSNKNQTKSFSSSEPIAEQLDHSFDRLKSPASNISVRSLLILAFLIGCLVGVVFHALIAKVPEQKNLQSVHDETD